jgi:branched-chain amino acid aminotransferase
MFDTTHFPKAKKIWYMGKILNWDEVMVHSQSHALHYGSSVFEGIRAYPTDNGPAVFRLDEHIRRFMHSARVLKMKTPYTESEIMDAIKLVIRENRLEAAYIRPLMLYTYGNLGLIPRACPVELIISTWEWGAYLGEESVHGVKVYILPWRRIHHSQHHMGAKLGGNYVQSTFCGMIAREKGYDEGIFLNLEGNVAEGPGENILVVKDGVVATNDRTESILEGITRTTVLKIAQDLGIKTEIRPITKADLCGADEVMFTGTAVEVVPITHITDGSVPGETDKEYMVADGQAGPMTKRLRAAYMETVSGKRPEYAEWLTYVNS